MSPPKKEKPVLTAVVTPSVESVMPGMHVLKAAAARVPQPQENTQHTAVNPQIAWARHRQSVTRPKNAPTGEARFPAGPRPVSVVPLSRREKRPAVSYIRMRAVDLFEVVSHVLVDGELREPTVMKFTSLELAYEHQMLTLMACRERDLMILEDYKKDQAGK